MTEIKVFATTPPTIKSSTFSYYTPTLHVLRGYKDAYAAADYWKKFTNIVDDLEESSVTRGDANGDGEISVADVMFIVNDILGTPDETFNEEAADANQDGEISVADVMYVVQYILNGKYPDEE